MSIQVKCAGCGRRLTVPDDAAGRKARCPKCGASNRVPAAPVAGAPPGSEPEVDAGNIDDLLRQAARFEESVAADQVTADSSPDLSVRRAPDAGRAADSEDYAAPGAGSGYAVAEEREARPVDPNKVDDTAPARTWPRSVKLGAGAVVAVIVLAAVGFGLRTSGKEKGIRLDPPPAAAPAPVRPGGTTPGASAWPPTKPAALARVEEALLRGRTIQVDVVEMDAREGLKPLLLAGSARAADLDVGDVTLRDGAGGGTSLRLIQSNLLTWLREELAARLKARGLTVVSAADLSRAAGAAPASRVQVVVKFAPATAGFMFQSRSVRSTPARGPAVPEDAGAGRPASPRARFLDSLASLNGERAEKFEPADAYGALRGTHWIAMPSDDPGAEQIVCGVRVSLAQVTWDLGGQKLTLLAPAAPGVTGELSFTHRPRALREVQLANRSETGEGPAVIAGHCAYDDLNLRKPSDDAAAAAAALLASPDSAWEVVWSALSQDSEVLTAAYRHLLRLGAGESVASICGAQADRVQPGSLEALAAVLKDPGNNPAWVAPFTKVKGPCADAAVTCLARRGEASGREQFQQWLASPGEHSPESVQAAAGALIDLGQKSADLEAAIANRTVKEFPSVRVPRGALALSPAAAQVVLDWLMQEGSPYQRATAVAAAAAGNVEALRPQVRAYLDRPTLDPEALVGLCRTLEKAQGPMAFDVFATVARRCLARTEVGERQVAVAADASGMSGDGVTGVPRHRLTLAWLVCEALVRIDKEKAGEVFVDLLRSPGGATRIAAIEGLLVTEYPDAGDEILTRYTELNKKPAAMRDPWERQEYDLLKRENLKLRHYDIALRSADALREGGKADDAKAEYRRIVREKPGSKLARRAQDALDKMASSAPADGAN